MRSDWSRVLGMRAAVAAVLVTLTACAAPGSATGGGTATSAVVTTPLPSTAPASSTIPRSRMATSAADTVSSSSTASPSASRRSTTEPAATTATSSPTPAPEAAPKALYGTASRPIRVELTGQVLEDPQHTVVMCPPYAVAGVGTTSKEIPTPECSHSIPVSGVVLDAAHLTFAGHNATHSWGQTHIEARWNGRELTATSQRRPTDGDRDPTDSLPTAVACPAPNGGWKVGGIQDNDAISKIGAAVGADFGALAMGYPHGLPTNENGSNPSYSLDHTEQVLVVGTTGDIAAATAAIRKVYGDNLCVVHTSISGADISRQYEPINSTFDGLWDRYGIMSTGSRVRTLGTETNQIDLVVRTPEFDKLIAAIPGPAITVNAWIHPVG